MKFSLHINEKRADAFSPPSFFLIKITDIVLTIDAYSAVVKCQIGPGY